MGRFAKLATEVERLKAIEKEMLASPDQQISLDPDSRSMATSGRGSGVVGYNVQVAVDMGTGSVACRRKRKVMPARTRRRKALVATAAGDAAPIMTRVFDVTAPR